MTKFKVLTKNFVTFKGWDGVVLYIGGDFLKRGGLRQFADLRRGLAKKRGMLFLRGVDTSMRMEQNCLGQKLS